MSSIFYKSSYFIHNQSKPLIDSREMITVVIDMFVTNVGDKLLLMVILNLFY